MGRFIWVMTNPLLWFIGLQLCFTNYIKWSATLLHIACYDVFLSIQLASFMFFPLSNWQFIKKLLFWTISNTSDPTKMSHYGSSQNVATKICTLKKFILVMTPKGKQNWKKKTCVPCWITKTHYYNSLETWHQKQ